jgi:hypothetical protein
MNTKKVRIDEIVLNKVTKFRKKGLNHLKYSSDKFFVQIAILKLLKEEQKQYRSHSSDVFSID